MGIVFGDDLYEYAKTDKRVFDFIVQNGITQTLFCDAEKIEDLFFSALLCDGIGYAAWELSDKTLRTQIIDSVELNNVVASIVRWQQQPFEHILQYRCKNGTLSAIRYKGFVIADETAGGRAIIAAFSLARTDVLLDGELYRSILYTAMDGYWLLDMQGNIIDVNYRYCQMSGYSEMELLTMGIRDLEADESHIEVENHIERVIQTGGDRFESLHRRKDGSTFDVEVSVQFKKLNAGFFVVFLRDITHRRTIERELLKQENEYRALFNNVQIGVFTMRYDGNGILTCNKKFLAILDYESKLPDELHNINVWCYETEKERIIATLKTHGAVYNKECVLIDRNNSPVYCIVWLKLNQETGVITGSLVDISIQKEAETAAVKAKMRAEKSEENYKLIFNSTGTSNSIFDNDCVLREQNHQSIKVLGRNGYGCSVYELFGEKEGKIVYDRMKQVLAEKQSAVFETKFALPTGVNWFRSVYQPMIDEYGDCRGIQVISQNITELKQIELDLRRAKEQAEEREKAYRDVVQTTGDLITVVDRTGIVLFVNHASVLFWGIEPENCIGTNAFDYVYEGDVETTKRDFDRWRNSDETKVSCINRFVNPQGVVALASWNIHIERDENGEVVKFTSIARDISLERKIFREQLKLANVVEKSLNEIYLFNESTLLFEYLNDSALKNMGYSMSELQNLTPIDIKPDIDAESFNVLIQPLKAGAQDKLVFITRHQRKDGTVYPVEVHLQLIDQQPDRLFLAVINDISERLVQEQEINLAKRKLEESEAKFRAAFYTSPDAVTITNFDGVYIEVNEGYTRISGYEKDEVIGKKSTDINIWEKPEDRQRFVDALQNNGFFENFEFNFRTKTGTLIPTLMSGIIVTLNDQPHLLAVSRNITERKNYERELIAAKEKAEESDRLKTAFLQNMSHEIRTPMNAIVGFSELIPLNYDNREKVVRFTSIINQRCRDLLGIINDILDISKIESGQVQVFSESFTLHELFNDMLAFFVEYQTRLNKQNIRFLANIPEYLQQQTITSDKVKVKQIFINLINNSLKFTEQGEIECGCLIGDENKMVFYVRDTGIGIPDAMHQEIFNRFSQVELRSRQNYGGTGLGLSIVKGLTELLGGRIWVESEVNVGSCFFFTIN